MAEKDFGRCENAEHEYTHVSNREDMANQYGKRWDASRVTIYCKKCGHVSKDSIVNNSAV